MKHWNTRTIAEAIGIFAVVCSLVFVGLELRQNSVATMAQTNSNIAEEFVELNLAMATSADLARAMTSYTDDPATASPADQVQILGLWRALFHTWSNAHRQHLSGTLDPAIYASIVQEISTYANAGEGAGAHVNNVKDLSRRKRVMRWAWENERFIFNPDFQVFVDGILGVER
jgi:hypothetical protein